MLNAANYKAKNKPLKQPVVDASIEMFPADGSDRKTLRRERMLNIPMWPMEFFVQFQGPRQEGMGGHQGLSSASCLQLPISKPVVLHAIPQKLILSFL